MTKKRKLIWKGTYGEAKKHPLFKLGAEEERQKIIEIIDEEIKCCKNYGKEEEWDMIEDTLKIKADRLEDFKKAVEELKNLSEEEKDKK